MPISVRNAGMADLLVLTAIKGEGSEAVHRDRLRDASDMGFRYLVLLADQEVIGFACLVFRRSAYWSDGEDTGRLPEIVDLQVKETYRGQGYGSAFIHRIEQIAVDAEYRQIFIRVEPVSNPRAYALYLRLGYQPMQQEPYWKTWEFTDSAGKLHHGEEWTLDMVKQL